MYLLGEVSEFPWPSVSSLRNGNHQAGKKGVLGLPWGPVVKTVLTKTHTEQGVGVLSLVEELRSHVPLDQNPKQNRSNTVTNSIQI